MDNNIDLLSILDKWTDAQFLTSFTKEEISKMSPSEVIEKKSQIRKTYVDHLLSLDGHFFPELEEAPLAIFRPRATVVIDKDGNTRVEE